MLSMESLLWAGCWQEGYRRRGEAGWGRGGVGQGWRRCESPRGQGRRQESYVGPAGVGLRGAQHRGYWPQRPATWLVTHPVSEPRASYLRQVRSGVS